MNFKNNITTFFSSYFLIFISILIGLRVINQYLKFDDRPLAEFYSSDRVLPNGDFIDNVAHPKEYSIKSKGRDTILLVGDSFGVGQRCGNDNNIAGCLGDLTSKHIVNLSKGGATPAIYHDRLSKYLGSQRSLSNKLKGEKVYIVLYSNDILIDNQTCNYYFENKNDLNILNSKEKEFMNEICTQAKKNNNYIDLNNNFEIIRSKSQFMRRIVGNYVYTLLEEVIGRIILQSGLRTSGRSGYATIWNGNSTQLKLVGHILNDIRNLCIKESCEVQYAFFPNVENININSRLYQSFLHFQGYMNKKYRITIHNGYLPFIDKGIKVARYSLTDVHSNCYGYKLFANWLLTLN